MARIPNETELLETMGGNGNYSRDATANAPLVPAQPADTQPPPVPHRAVKPSSLHGIQTETELPGDPRRIAEVSGKEANGIQSAWVGALKRARALAVMDPISLDYLASLTHGKIEHADNFAQKVSEPRGWLKLALLVQAGYVELLDSSVRITPEGQSALNLLREYAKLQRQPLDSD